MGILARLLGRSQPSQGGVGAARAVEVLLLSGDETLEVVGESFYQDALWRIVGGVRDEAVRHPVVAMLIPEPENEHDPNAIGIHVDGYLVGYLSRHDALTYGPGLKMLMRDNPGLPIALEGVVVGGGLRQNGRGFLGVFLDHSPADFGLDPNRVPRIGELRTGLSEALASDAADDRYNLAWLRQLSGDDVRDIRLLRELLEAETDPIDRHYMFSELCRSLYRSREAFASALEEFDEVCRQHHAEMVTIRPALLEKFGQVPLVDMYRQAAIRCQKARDWTGARDWAERGLLVYGSDAARPEAVADLRKRLDYATAKLAEADRPRARRSPRTTVAVPSAASVTEMLLCVECGATFERVRARGRKPQRCPPCRGIPPAPDAPEDATA